MSSAEEQEALVKYVKSHEPLHNEKIRFILDYKGETLHIDFKVSFDTGETREWLNITKDIIAFANTTGGYLVFGIEDKTFNKVGISEKDARFLADPNNIHQKINTYIQPPITSLTSVYVNIDENHFAVVHIPESRGRTHIIVKEGKFKNKSAGEHIVLRKGEIYVRRSGSNELIEPSDLDDIIRRRINYYKEDLLKNISKIIEAPPEYKVLLYAPGDTIPENAKQFYYSNSPDAIPIKGISTTEVPQTLEAEIATSIALFKKDRSHKPGAGLLYNLYSRRKELNSLAEFYKDIVLLSIYKDVPCFYWLQFISRENAKDILDEIIEKGGYQAKFKALKVAACLGESSIKKYTERTKSDERYKRVYEKYKSQGIEGIFHQFGIQKDTIEQLESKATELVQKLVEHKGLPTDEEMLWAIDFRLYAKGICQLG